MHLYIIQSDYCEEKSFHIWLYKPLQSFGPIQLGIPATFVLLKMFVYANTTDVILNIYSNFVDNIGTLFNLFYIEKCDKIVLLLLNAIFT